MADFILTAGIKIKKNAAFQPHFRIDQKGD
jgi:hypothetical protein